MAEFEVTKALKDLPYRIQAASLKERTLTVKCVKNIVDHPDFNENILKGICKVIQLTLPRYRDSFSQSLVSDLIVELLNKHPEWAIKGLTNLITDIAKQQKCLVTTQYTTQNSLYTLNWSVLVLKNAYKRGPDTMKDEIKLLIINQSVFITAVYEGNNKKKQLKAYSKLNHLWQTYPDMVTIYLDALKNLEQSYYTVILGATLAKHLEEHNKKDLLNNYLDYLVDVFVKTLVSCKTRPLPAHIEACHPLLMRVTDEQFRTLLLPALQKAMLRNPEVILEGVGLVLSGVSIDLSNYAMDIGKSIISNLHAKDDLARKQAAEACEILAKKIRKATAIESLLDQTFAVFNGSNGKLNVADHKMSVLLGAGNFSKNCVIGADLFKVTDIAIDYFFKVLGVEVHEKTLCHAIEMLSYWIAKHNEIPKRVLDGLKNGMTLKSSTIPVKTAYIECILKCFNDSNVNQIECLIPTISKEFDKCISQPSQIPAITEALAAACLMTKFVSSENKMEKIPNNIWAVIFDMEKQVFISEKFITSASDNAILLVMQLCERLLIGFPEKIIGKPNPVYRAILLCAISISLELREKCFGLLKKIVNGTNGNVLAQALLKDLKEYLEATKIQNKNEKEKKEDNSTEISSHLLANLIRILCSNTNLQKEDAEKVVLDAILPSHHVSVVAVAPKLWINIVKHYKLQPKNVIAQNFPYIKKIVIDNYCNSLTYQYALKTLSQLNGEFIVPSVIDTFITKLSDKGIIEITKDDYFTYLTPQGELYDKSVLPDNDLNTDMNMKRESKVYSYKDQLEEMQLRRELEEKKRKEGKIKVPQYTPKQLEAIKNQKTKEDRIRQTLEKFNTTIVNCASMIEAIVSGNKRQLSYYFNNLLPVILDAMISPLAAPYLVKLFINLRMAVFDKNDYTSDLIAHLTLRLVKPQCDLDRSWEQEPLESAVVRTLGILHKQIVQKNGNVEYQNAPCFCYIFPFVQLSLLLKSTKNRDNFVHDGLQIISEYAKIRGDITNPMYCPKFLPRRQMFELLIKLISSTSGRIQTQAEACILDVAASAGGYEGCYPASIDEINVLLAALQSSIEVVRDAALRGLSLMISSIPSFEKNYDVALCISKRLWIAKFDVSIENRNLAAKLWDSAQLEFPPNLCGELTEDVIHPVECIQAATAEALAALLVENHKEVRAILQKLLGIYKEKLTLIPPKLDEFGRTIEKAIDVWSPRRGVALALTQIAPLIDPDVVGDLIDFFVSIALGDREEKVRNEMRTAALRVVDLHGKDAVSTLLPIFENFMDKSSKSAQYDDVKRAVVILMGSLAKHLDKEDPRIKPIVIRLISALSTPSQNVQEAVANCLPPLVPSVKEDAPGLVNKLLHQLLKSDKYGDRRGAAHGLAGMVKGMGILALKQLDIMTKLTDAIQDKKNYKHREGALFAFEILFQMLGKLFEPYIVHALPHLLQCFGDSSQYVRAAADDTSKVIMSKLSNHGVKLVLPSLLMALEEDSWRTKTGSVELLGSMAYCAPKQLSSCLPNIVPKLIEVLSDSHMKVQEAGAEALRVIGSVIRNPEIQAIVPVLLQALQDPSNKTSMCLQTLLDTQFVHFIDAPSLALIMPVVQRAFMDRSTETRKMAAQIIGNMYSLTDQKDLLPYLPTIIPGLKMSLLDPVPEVRSVSARALGAMVRGMGESSFEDLLPWLMQTLTSETSSVDRSGAAQGLSEVVGGLGVEKLHKFMPEIIATAERTDIAPHVKDGYIMMFIYIPVVFVKDFTPYIGQIINPILKALADENEYVRDTALKAGQRIVTLYAESAITLLLPELERGLFDENWRIRYSSVQLLGDLLYKISGVTGKMSTETASEDDNFGTEQSHEAIINILGAERRNRVLAGLYMGRSDVALMVRQAALHVWKVVVTNTPRTLREILPTLFGLLLGCLASDSYDKRQVAARTLGDLVRKLGERVLPEIIPILEKGLQSDQPDQRQGVCIGLSEIMTSTSKEMVLTFVNSLVPTVRKALCDPLPEVRQAAAKTFDSLHSTVGSRALDDILPALLNQLNNENSEVVEWTLDGLRQVMAIKSRVVLPYLVPQLTAPPANTKALSILASVAGEALNKYLPRILPALQSSLATSRGTSNEIQQLEYCQAVVLSVADEAGIRTIIDTLLENTRNDNADQRRAAATLLCGFCANSKAQYTQHVSQLYRGLIHLCTDSDRDVLQMTWEALNAVTRTLDSKLQATYVSDVRQAVRYAVSDMKGTSDLLPGFCLPKGIVPILPIFREAILNGDGDEKEAAAQGLGEIIKVASPSALQPSVVTITGPLIRILGDRFSSNVKIAVLETLAILLEKVDIMLKQFLPQLQTTFLKALSDPNRIVRLKSATALGYLILIHQRADPLFIDLYNTIKNTDDSSIRETTLHALRGIIGPAGNKCTDQTRKQIHISLIGLLSHPEDVTRNVAAGCLGALCKWLTPEQLQTTLSDYLLNDDPQYDCVTRQSRGAALSVALKESSELLWSDLYRDKLLSTLLSQLAADKVPVTLTAVRSCGYLLQYLLLNSHSLPLNLLGPFVKTMNNNSNEVKQLLARVCIHLAKTVPQDKLTPELLKLLLPMLVNGTKEKNGYVKANSEIALIAVLRLKDGDEMHNKCLKMLDAGAQESLSDVVSKVLRKIMSQPEGKDEELDDTLLT